MRSSKGMFSSSAYRPSQKSHVPLVLTVILQVSSGGEDIMQDLELGMEPGGQPEGGPGDGGGTGEDLRIRSTVASSDRTGLMMAVEAS
jgi:hypothetical protein